MQGFNIRIFISSETSEVLQFTASEAEEVDKVSLVCILFLHPGLPVVGVFTLSFLLILII